jgi:hypothetical protein
MLIRVMAMEGMKERGKPVTMEATMMAVGATAAQEETVAVVMKAVGVIAVLEETAVAEVMEAVVAGDKLQR